MSNHSVIEHRANYHYFKLEEDYVLICSNGEQYPQCKAAILAILEHWMNDKRSKGQDEHIYMTYPEWIAAMYGLFRRSTIIACLAELVQEKLVLRRPCMRYGKETYEYSLNVRLIQERIKHLEERDEKNWRLNLNAFKFKRVQKQTDTNLDGSTDTNLDGTSSEAFKNKRNIDSITEIPSSNIDSERAHPSLQRGAINETGDILNQTLEEVKTASGKHKAVSSHSQGAIGSDEDISLAETAHRMPAVKIGAPNANSHLHPGDNIATTGDNRIHSLQDLRGTEEDEQQNITSGELVPSQDDAAPAANPPASSGPRASRVVPSRPRNTSRARDPLPVPAEAERIMDDWDSLFKSPLARTEKHIKAAISLVPCNPSKADLKACKNWLFTTDNPQKPWFRKKGVALQDIAENYGQWQSVQDEPQEEASEQEYGVSGLPRLKPLGSVK